MSVFLWGPMGSGKSTVGRLLAKASGWRLVDVDRAVEERSGQSVAEIFASQGEGAFRALEREIVEGCLAEREPLVVALGGGSLLDRALRRRALERGTLIVLRAPVEALARRLEGKTDRPLLAGVPLGEKLESLVRERAEAYAECHAELETEGRGLNEIVAEARSIAERRRVVVPLGLRTYVVEVGHGWGPLVEYFARQKPNGIFRVSDSNVAGAQGHDLAQAFAWAQPFDSILEPGEERKSLETLNVLWQKAQSLEADRWWTFLGVGGGVITDITGFAAATWLRGVPWVACPTSLLGMVDAAVGGKTGIDFGSAKNAVGAIHQPSFVFENIRALTTEPERSFRSGLAEVVKTALLDGEEFLALLEANVDPILRRDPKALAEVVFRSVAHKARVVANDERESGLRATLNLGHTLGHAIEAFGAWAQWRHGEAVSLGLGLALRLGVEFGITEASLPGRVERLLHRLGLPTQVSRETLLGALPYLRHDKKRSATKVRFVFVRRPGEPLIEATELEKIEAAVIRMAEASR
ncbi:MAG TPA: 3-dehydroquinate synthase [Polyangiaceae bacterium]|nr:3-dehydroquinate synthase [Polyangiaceae bacterium]